MSRPAKYDWPRVLEAAIQFIYATRSGVTLRQAFYNLVKRGILENTDSIYRQLSAKTTTARDEGRFPDFTDNTRRIVQPVSFDDPDDAMVALHEQYRRDRTEFQDTYIYLVVEKAGMVGQLDAWFSDYGFPIVALGGWAPQTLREKIRRAIVADGRPTVCLYAGDFDPSGVFIGQKFAEQVGVFDKVIRVGLNVDQLDGLPHNPYPDQKRGNPMIGRFVARYGGELEERGYPQLVQFELDALSPETLRRLYQDGIDQFMVMSAYDQSLEQERLDRAELVRRWSAS